MSHACKYAMAMFSYEFEGVSRSQLLGLVLWWENPVARGGRLRTIYGALEIKNIIMIISEDHDISVYSARTKGQLQLCRIR